MIHRKRLTARMDTPFAVFLIGMRINNPFLVHKWLPVTMAMTRMLKELYRQPELGFLSHEMWFSRTIIVMQYWSSIDALLAYATAKDHAHLPAWQSFNRAIGTDGAVGIWHETYIASAGMYENVYVNMPAFGLGKAAHLVEARASLKSAVGRLRSVHDEHPPSGAAS